MNKKLLFALLISLGLFIVCVFRTVLFPQFFNSPLGAAAGLYFVVILITFGSWHFLKVEKKIWGWGGGKEDRALQWFLGVLVFLLFGLGHHHHLALARVRRSKFFFEAAWCKGLASLSVHGVDGAHS